MIQHTPTSYDVAALRAAAFAPTGWAEILVQWPDGVQDWDSWSDEDLADADLGLISRITKALAHGAQVRVRPDIGDDCSIWGRPWTTIG